MAVPEELVIFQKLFFIVLGVFALIVLWMFTLGAVHYYPTQSECVEASNQRCEYARCELNCRWGTKGSGWVVGK
jgi:hypothetical protein